MSSPSDAATSIQTLAATLLNAIVDPADGIRIFAQLNAFAIATIGATSSLASSENSASGAVADLCRRTAATALARASSYYQPSSQNDAQNIQSIVCGILDAEILVAGDQGQDEMFYALTDLRNSVAKDLTRRGANLPPLKTFSTNVPMPALTLAYQYYGDINRTDQLIDSAAAVHPAMMPVSFQALSS